jgi:hypothetical protein
MYTLKIRSDSAIHQDLTFVNATGDNIVGNSPRGCVGVCLASDSPRGVPQPVTLGRRNAFISTCKVPAIFIRFSQKFEYGDKL